MKFEIIDKIVSCCEKAQLEKLSTGGCPVKMKDGLLVCAYCEKESAVVVVPTSPNTEPQEQH